MFERGENLDYVTWIRRLNPVHSVRIVSRRFSNRYVVRDFGFCDLNSPDIFRMARVFGAIIIKLVPIGFTAGIQQNTDANLPIMATNLCQRFVEVTLVLPLNVPRALTWQPNLDSGIGFCARDGWKIAAADDRNDRDYAYYNKPESYR